MFLADATYLTVYEENPAGHMTVIICFPQVSASGHGVLKIPPSPWIIVIQSPSLYTCVFIAVHGLYTSLTI